MLFIYQQLPIDSLPIEINIEGFKMVNTNDNNADEDNVNESKVSSTDDIDHIIDEALKPPSEPKTEEISPVVESPNQTLLKKYGVIDVREVSGLQRLIDRNGDVGAFLAVNL